MSPFYFDIHPALRLQAGRCVDQLDLIQKLETMGHLDEALQLSALTLSAAREIQAQALMPWRPTLDGGIIGLTTPGARGLGERFLNGIIGVSMGWLIGHAGQASAIDELDYLVEALQEITARLQTSIDARPPRTPDPDATPATPATKAAAAAQPHTS